MTIEDVLKMTDPQTVEALCKRLEALAEEYADSPKIYRILFEVMSVLRRQAAQVAELEAESHELTKALTGLTCGGSEFFNRKGKRFVADTEACVAWVRRRDQNAAQRSIDAIKARQAAEAQRDAAVKRASELEEAIRWALGEGDSDFGDNIPIERRLGRPGAFWWRKELRQRAALQPTPEEK